MLTSLGIIIGVSAVIIMLAAVLIKVLAFPDTEQNEKDPGSGNAVNDIDRADEEQKSTAVITLDGGTAVEIKLGEGYTDPGYSAQDADGTDLTDQVQVDTSALNRAGEQQVIYTVKDSLGRETQAVRNVTVLPNTEYEVPDDGVQNPGIVPPPDASLHLPQRYCLRADS